MAVSEAHAYARQVIESGFELMPPTSPPERIVETVETDDGAWQIGIATFDARIHDKDFGTYGPTCLMALGYEADTTTPYDTQTWQTIAETMGARLIIVDTPGFGEESAPLQTSFGFRLARGDLRPPAELMVRAVGQSGLLENNEEISLMGYSMGSLTIANIAEVLQTPDAKLGIPKVRIAGVYLLDPTSPRFIKTLSDDIRADGAEGLAFYQGLNERYSWLVAPPETTNPKHHQALRRRQLTARALYGIAMARDHGDPSRALELAVIEDSHDGATGLSEGTIKVMRGELSRLALDAPTNRLLTVVRNRLHPAGYADRVTLPGENHFWPHAAILGAAASEHLRS